MCVHRHRAHQNAGGVDTLESVGFLQFVQVLKRRLHNLSYESMEILKKIASNHHHSEDICLHGLPSTDSSTVHYV